MKRKYYLVFLFLFLSLVAGCLSRDSEFSTLCKDKQALFCEDFEGIDPALGGNQLVTSTSIDQWWITSDDDHDYLFQDFPLFGRTRNNMILLSGGSYEDRSASFLYTREIDLTPATRASLSYNLIYRTEKHWDGLVVFAVMDGNAGVGNPNNWIMLTPGEGYPDSVLINGSLVPGYSGISAGWKHHEVDLSPFLGKKLILGFYFVSDDYLDDWGIGLDDIVVEADVGTISDQAVGLSELAIDTLVFPHDSMISADLPRANPQASVVCIGTGEALSELSDRAIIKAISEAGEHVLVLHPGARSLCWVRQDEIWIDGDPTKLPHIAETALKNYLPISSLRHTPVLADNDCLSGNETSLPIQMQAALIEHGKITRLLFESILPPGIDFASLDPRVGTPQEFPEIHADFSPGGELWIEMDGIRTICLADWSQPGRIICQELAFDISRPLQFEVCWQGWDDNQSCPIGYSVDQTGTNCVPVEETVSCSLNCLPGYYLDSHSKTCLMDTRDDTLEEDLYACPPGYLYHPLFGRCHGQEYLTETNCPTSTYYVAGDNQCVSIGEGDICPDGYRSLTGSKECVPVNHSTTPHCRVFDFQFPSSEVTVKESTRCLKDPENPNEIVSSLKPFDSVEVLGLGEDGETLVVNNPDYKIPCWAPLTDFYLDDLDIGILPIISGGKSE